MKTPNLFENYVYNALFQIFRIISPVLTIPYITRVLDSDGIGAFAYTNSIVNIFTMAGALGIGIYGTKVIAYSRDDIEKRSAVFWELFTLNFLTNIVALIFFLIFVHFSEESFKQLYYIQSTIFLIGIFEITWFFTGLEDFKKTSIRLFITRVIGICAIFIFVKTKADLPIYTFIIAIHGLLGCIFLWTQLKNQVKFCMPKFKNIFSHLPSNFTMFIPLFAAYVFAVIDKIMLGNISGIKATGVYEMADRLIKIILPFALSLGPVMLPRVANSIANKEIDKISFYLTKSFSAVSYMAIPVTFGIIATSKEFIPWFLGDEFSSASFIISILSLTIILNAWKSVANVQILIPYGKELICAGITFVGLLLKYMFNIILIPAYNGFGAAVSTFITEIILTALFMYFAAPYMKFQGFYKGFFVELVKFFIAGVIMYIPVRIIGNIMGIGYLTTLLQVIIGVLSYWAMIVVLKSSTHKFIMDKITASVFKKRDNPVLERS